MLVTYVGHVLAGGDPVIAFVDRGPGRRLCRLCLAEWSTVIGPDHVHGCPAGASGPDRPGSGPLPPTTNAHEGER